jgi:hypothetical protein
MPTDADRRVSRAAGSSGERPVTDAGIRPKRQTPSWLEPVDLGALVTAVDDERTKRRRGEGNAPSTSSERTGGGEGDRDSGGDSGGEGDEDVHAWMREALRSHLLDGSKEEGGEGGSMQEVEIAEESLDVLATCLGGVLEKVLAEAKGGAKGAGELTSLDIHKSIKSLFPDKGGEGKKGLRPYLPRVVKDAWRLDKKSLPKGAKKRSGVSRR